MNMTEYEYAGRSEKKRSFFPFLAASIIGAVIGSGVTLYMAPTLGIQQHAEKKETTSQQEAVKSSALPLEPTASTSNSNMVQAIENVADAVVGVINIQQQADIFSGASAEQDTGTGSGVIFKKAGDVAYIVTNNHVVEGANKVEVSLPSGERVKATIVGTDPLSDLAVLKINGKNVKKVASFGDSSTLRVGEQVAAIGNPLGLDLSRTVTEGIVSGKRTISVSTSEGEWELNVIQTDAAINPGNSGGALINSAGQVVGINSLKIAQEGIEGLGFALPSQYVQPVIEQLMEYGKVKRPYLGVNLRDLSEIPAETRFEQLGLPENETNGVVVTAVLPSSPAAEAGIQAKDVIVAINGTKVNNVSELRKYLYTKTKVGEKIQLQILRDGKSKTILLQLKERQEQQ
ncbi:trypsin-like peptidase domain-containing protein [Anoxybacillus rupiensis]|jgi:serine protease Do|uniref:Trypsin-like peptidase domain-containing protein n=1 Tax=Anoxybacteroides rupiense TaxID=311460 RepID=A0ABT5W251_9BACL|nr:MULTISPECIES: trypsin-like peptidase domain-containing protein [Anoxybacillus]MDE8563408.1 trypsin-like peptidase domain-containing protein [Anoxybacillus rupiensis]QHC02940.1 PDZ domain-containing protein [Anoxybacillus sp. PDR2]